MSDLPIIAPDSFADRALRFCIGAVLGVIAGWSLSFYGSSWESGTDLISLLGGCAVGLGAASVVGGNRFIEWVIRHVST